MPTSSAAGFRSVAVRPRSAEMVVTVAHRKASSTTTASQQDGTNNAAAASTPANKPTSSSNASNAGSSSAAPAPRPRASSPSSVPRAPVASRDVNLDNFEDSAPIKGVLNSPRSLQVCGRFGIHPSELLHRPVQQFTAPGVPQTVARMRFDHFEASRAKKVEMLRAERAAMPEPQPAPVSRQPSTNARRQASPAARTRVPVAAARPSSAPPPTRRASTPQPKRSAPATPRSDSATRPSSPAAQAAPSPAARQRAEAIRVANERREAAKQRAAELAARRESEAVFKQREREGRSQQHVRALLDKKVCALEYQKLKRDDAMDRVRQLGRIKQYNSDIRATQWEGKVAARRSDPFALLAARNDYRTPRDRVERARSASAPRSASNQAA